MQSAAAAASRRRPYYNQVWYRNPRCNKIRVYRRVFGLPRPPRPPSQSYASERLSDADDDLGQSHMAYTIHGIYYSARRPIHDPHHSKHHSLSLTGSGTYSNNKQQPLRL